MHHPPKTFISHTLTTSLLALACLADLGNAQTCANVPGTSDPWLAGMPNGSMASGGDVAPDESPVVLALSSFAPGPLQFRAEGLVGFAGTPTDEPDGSTLFADHQAGAENGISNIVAPANALLGVFLNNAPPSVTPAPGTLDFGPGGNVPGGIDYAVITPELGQVFFIGDGLDDNGALQTIVPPSGATRIALGPMDGFGWFNNSGSFDVLVNPNSAAWSCLGPALGGTLGEPTIAGTGTLVAGTPMSVSLTGALPSAPAILVVGLSTLEAPFKGGILVPAPDFVFSLATNAAGNSFVPATWPAGVPSGFATAFQWWQPDAGAPANFASTPGLLGTAP